MFMNTCQTDKLRYIYIGHTLNDNYIYLECDLTPNQIIQRTQQKILMEKSFTLDQTDWGGCDSLEHICKLKSIIPQDKFPLTENLVFCGTDFDHGYAYKWVIRVDMLMTVK